MTWVEMKLGDALTLKRGYDLPTSQREPGPVPTVSSSGVTGRHSTAKVEGPGVVTGRYGTLGEVYFIREDFWPLNTALYVKDFKGNEPRFATYFLRYVLRGTTSDKAAVPGVNRNDLHARDVSFPDLGTQVHIAGILAAYDDLIESNRRRMQLLEESARLLFREWFVHLRFPGHEHVPVVDGVPEGWERRELGNCAKFQSGGTPSKKKQELWNGDIPWVSSGELKTMRIHRTALNVSEDAIGSGTRLVPVDTILAVVRGMSLAKEFRLGIAARPVTFNQDIKALTSKDGVDPLFLFHAIEVQRDAIRDRAGDASHGTKKLETPVLEAIPVLLPPPALQEAFRDTASVLHAQWDVLHEQSAGLEQARDLLLPRLMSGALAA